ncbi:MAG: NAD(P)-dependent oxidoreductase [Acidimicrobiales bacterium]
MTTNDPVGVIGVGELGGCFVERFHAGGHEVWAFDVDDRALQRAAVAGARPSTGPAEVAARCTTVVTCVTGPDDVRDCVLGPNGLVASVGPRHLVIDTTTSIASMTRMVAERLGAAGALMVDAPVSRGVPAALRGQLSIMVGGSHNGVERARPLLGELGTDIVHVGLIGAGHAVKLVNMMLMGVHLVGLAEAIGNGACAGLPAGDLVAQFRCSTSASYMTEVHLPRYVIGGSYASGFRLQLMAKDVRLARQMGAELGLVLPNLETVCEAYDRACTVLPPEADNMLVVPFLSGLTAGMTEVDAASAAHGQRLPEPVGTLPGNGRDTLRRIDAQLAARNEAAAREAATLLRAAGVDLEVAFAVIHMSSGSSRWTSRPPGRKGRDGPSGQVPVPA